MSKQEIIYYIFLVIIGIGYIYYWNHVSINPKERNKNEKK